MSTEAMLEVLERAADDIYLYSQLAEDPQVALKDFDLTSEEKAALSSGVVDRDGQIEHGDIVAALVDGELYLARLRKIADELYLENNEGRIKLEDCQVATPVIEVRRRLK